MKDIANEYEGETILITGGAGCVGSNLTRRLVQCNPEKIIILMIYHPHINGTYQKMIVSSLLKVTSVMIKYLNGLSRKNHRMYST